ncbi:hypothetical protein ACLOJK_020518 [Asimina triloba]
MSCKKTEFLTGKMGSWFSICRGSGGLRVKNMRESLSEQVVDMFQLPSVSKRIIENGRSRNSCIFTQQGRKGINQDAMVVWEDFISDDTVFYGVFDGHGPQGHLVARKVRDMLPLELSSFLKSAEVGGGGIAGIHLKKVAVGDEEPLESSKNKPSADATIDWWEDAFLKSYIATDKELRHHPSLDCFCSGSTAVTLVKQGSNIFLANIGDSRAIMGSRNVNGSVDAVQLTVDLKPDLPGEAQRIKQCKGRVFALQDDPEVQRVWLPFEDTPGLAMSRAFGDFCLKDYGVISVPEFTHRTLTENDLFIVLASDGVWDVLSNEEVVEIVSSTPIRSSAANAVVNSAVREWKLKYPTSKIDDCAVVCLYLDGKMDSESKAVDSISGIAGAAVRIHPPELNRSSDEQNPPSCLQHSFTAAAAEGDPNGEKLVVGKAGGNLDEADENWSGLEGITRANSLVQLPRFTEEKVNA